MFIIADQRRSMSSADDLAFIKIEVTGKSAAFEVIDKVTVIAHFEHRIQNMRFAVNN